jgi:hypothetical protein
VGYFKILVIIQGPDPEVIPTREENMLKKTDKMEIIY